MKKVLFFAVTMALTASMVSAGGRTQGRASRAPQSPNDRNLNLTGLPIARNNSRALDFAMFFDNWENPPTAQAADAMEQETGIKVAYNPWSSSTARERWNIMVNTGDYPEVMGGWPFSRTDVMRLADDGVLIPLEDLIDKYTVHIKEALNLPGVRESITYNGHVWTIPYIVNEPLIYFVPWINQEWLDKLNLSMPATTAEFKNVLTAFRDNIKVNGQSIIPFSGDPYNLDLGKLAGWFGINASGKYKNEGFFAYAGNQIDFTANKPQYKEFIKYFADLYANKLIDPELYTQTQEMYNARAKQEVYGVAFSYGAGGIADDNVRRGQFYETPYRPLPVLKGPGVAQPVMARINLGSVPNKGVQNYDTQLVITDKAVGNEIAIIRWLDHMYDPLTNVRNENGPLPGKNLPAKYTVLDSPLHLQRVDESGWTKAERDRYQYIWWGSLPHYGSKVVWEDSPAAPPKWKDLVAMQELYLPYLEPRVIQSSWNVSAADVSRRSILEPPIVEYVKQKMAEWISGQANVDAEWDAYLAQLDRYGLPELIQLRRKMAGG